MTNPVLISAGEASGEMYAAWLATALRPQAQIHLFGLGGQRMRDAGVQLIAESSEIAVVGITEAARRLPSAWRIYRKLVAEAARRRPRLAILVDFPDFNLRLARRLKSRGVRCVYFISPQVWAWRPGRVQLMRKVVDQVLCIFPFEEKIYRDAGVPVTFVGHPLVDRVRPTGSRPEIASRYALDSARPIVALLPGSRPGEIAHNLPPMLGACHLLGEKRPYQFLLAVAPGIQANELARHMLPGEAVRLVEGATYDVLAAADAAIASSGTATIEAALLATPMVVVYRVSRASALVLRRLVRTRFFSMVNLIAGRHVVPELIQEDFTPGRVAAEVERLIQSDEAREQMRRDLSEVRSRLGPGGAIERAARMIAGVL